MTKMTKENERNLLSLLKLGEVDAKSIVFDYLSAVNEGLIESEISIKFLSNKEMSMGNYFLRFLPVTTGIPREENEEWYTYTERVLGNDFRQWGLGYQFLFSHCWALKKETNTLEQALARLKYYIEKGYKVPSYFNDLNGGRYKATFSECPIHLPESKHSLEIFFNSLVKYFINVMGFAAIFVLSALVLSTTCLIIMWWWNFIIAAFNQIIN